MSVSRLLHSMRREIGEGRGPQPPLRVLLLGKDHTASILTLPSSSNAGLESEEPVPYVYIDGAASTGVAGAAENTDRRMTLGVYSPTTFHTAPGPHLGHKFIVAVGFWDTPSTE